MNQLQFFEQWVHSAKNFIHILALTRKNSLAAHEKDEFSHYSKSTTDVEYQFPFGWKEIEGIANRGDFDLTNTQTFG